jgi:hypothetical protein
MVTIETLDAAYEMHIKELKQINLMTDSQYRVFFRNFSIGKIDPGLTRDEVRNILISMITVNREISKRLKKDN